MAIYTSYQDLLYTESEASDAYKARKAKEAAASHKKDKDRAFRKGAALDAQAGGGRRGEKEGERRIKQAGNMSPSLKSRMKAASSGKVSEKDAMKTGLDTMRAIDAKDRHDRRHPKKESAGYGIFHSLLVEEQVDDAELGLGDTELGMGDRDFGDDMTPDVMMGENGVFFY